MTKLQLLASIAGLAALASSAHAQPVRVGIGIGFGAPGYRPYYAPYYGPYYRPYYYGPPSVVVAPPPVVYQQAPVVVQQQPVYSQPAPLASAPPPTDYQAARPSASIDGFLANLRNPDENVRRDSVMELGRMKSDAAVQPLTATLAGDQSPVVRDSAARALGLIGSPQALTALLHSAQADPDRDVRRSSQFSVDVIRTNSR